MTRATFEAGGLRFEVFKSALGQTITVYSGTTPIGVFTGNQIQELCAFLQSSVRFWEEPPPMVGIATTNNEVKDNG